MGMILVTASVAVFVWAVVGLIRPTWARLPSRAASVGVWVLSVVLFIIGGALMPDSTPEQTEQSAALGSQSVPPPTPEAVAAPATDERVHPESDFQAQVQRLIQQVTRPKPARSTTISRSRSTGRHQRFWRQRHATSSEISQRASG